MLSNNNLDTYRWEALSDQDERHIGFLISDVARLMRTAFDRRVRRLGLTRSQWLVINRLHRRPGATQSELADMLEVQKATAGRTVDRMEQKGGVARLAPALAGRVLQVRVRDHEPVKAGAALVKLDPEPFRLALDKAEADLDAARTTVETARAQFFETQSELGEVESQVDFLTRQFARQQS